MIQPKDNVREQPKTFWANVNTSRTADRAIARTNSIKARKFWSFLGRMEYWNLRTYFRGKSLFRHSCLGENSNCFLSMIHFTINLCLRSCHVRKRNREFCQTSKERRCSVDSGAPPAHPSFEINPDLRRDRGSWKELNIEASLRFLQPRS